MWLNSIELSKYNYEHIIQDIAFHKPKSLQAQSIQGVYYKNDPAIKIWLWEWKTMILRIWEKHMYDSNENIKFSEEGNIFISAYLLNPQSKKSHLSLYGWYRNDNYEWIWKKLLQK